MKIKPKSIVNFVMIATLLLANFSMAAGTSTHHASAGIDQLSSQFKNDFYGLVDSFTNKTKAIATVFVRKGDDFIRIATSMRNADGKRAINTILDHSSPAYKELIAGRHYVGEIDLFGNKYMAKYTPILDNQGDVVAVLFVGKKV